MKPQYLMIIINEPGRFLKPNSVYSLHALSVLLYIYSKLNPKAFALAFQHQGGFDR